MGNSQYTIVPSGLKITGVAYRQVMISIFYYMLHSDLEYYVDNIIIESKKDYNHVKDLRKDFCKMWEI